MNSTEAMQMENYWGNIPTFPNHKHVGHDKNVEASAEVMLADEYIKNLQAKMIKTTKNRRENLLSELRSNESEATFGMSHFQRLNTAENSKHALLFAQL